MEPEQAPQEQAPTPLTAEKPAVPKKRTVFSRFRQVLAWLLFIVATLGLSALVFVQTPTFRGLVISEVVSLLEGSTNGTLSIRAIQGNLWNGFTLDDVTVKLKNNRRYDSIPILHADHILVRFSLLQLIRRTDVISASSVVLDHPVINVVKLAGDSEWNIAMLTKPRIPNQPALPFSTIIDVSSLRMENGSMVVRDYNFPDRSAAVGLDAASRLANHEIDWSDVSLKGIDLDTRVYINGSTAQSVKVNHLRFHEERSDFFVQHIGFSGYLDSIQARIDEAKITTGNTSLWLSADIASPEFLRNGNFSSLKHAPVNVTLQGPVVSTFELKQILPKTLGFLGGSPGLDLDLTGEFGNLKVKRIALDFRNKRGITITGNLDHLDRPDSLWMNLALEARELSNATLDEYVPGLHIPNLSRFGTINIPRLTYTGIPQNFHTVFTTKTSGAGDVAADAFLDFRNHHFDYRTGLQTDHLDIAAFDAKLDKTSLNLDGKLTGSGTEWKTLTTAIELKTSSPSSYAKYKIQHLDLAATMKRGFADLSRLDAVLDGGPVAHVKRATIDLGAPAMPYTFDGTINDFRLAEVLPPTTRNPARIDLTATVRGTAKNFEEVSGTARARLFDLEYQGHALSDVNAELSLTPKSSSENTLSVRSEMANISIERRFRLGDLIRTVPQHIAVLMTAIRERDFPEAGMHFPLITQCADSIDFDYSVQIKDLRPLAGFVPQTFLLGEGMIYGNVSGCPAGDIGLTMEGDSLGFILRNREGVDSASLASSDSIAVRDSLSRKVMDALLQADRALRHKDSSLVVTDSMRPAALALPRFGGGSPRLHLTPTSFRLVAQNLSNDPKKVMDHLNASLDFRTDSVIRLGSALLYHPRFGLRFKDQHLNYDVSTIYNDALGIRLKGDASFPAGALDFVLDTLHATLLNHSPRASLREYRIFNDGPSHVRVAKDGLISVDTLKLIHPLTRGIDPHNASALRVNLGGTVKGDSVNAWGFVPSFYLEKLPEILITKPGSKSLGFADFRGKVRDVTLGMHGTLERPELAVRLHSDAMSYGPENNQLSFDSNFVDLSYKDQALRGSVVVHVAHDTGQQGSQSTSGFDSTSALRLTIDSIPLMIAFKHGPDFASDSTAVAVRPLSARVTTSHFPIDVAAPFISAFRELHGSGDINFAVTGTQEHIKYGGSATVRDGQFLLDGNRMWYLFDGGLVFADNSLKLQNIAVKNLYADDPQGQAVVNGNFDFKGFSIANFDLQLRSDHLKVLSEDSKAALKMIYGPLVINTGGKDFRFFHTFEEPWIKGTINILSGSLTSPQMDEIGQSSSTQGIVYRTISSDNSDTKGRTDTLRGASARDVLVSALRSGDASIPRADDSLFPNRLKNIYLNDDGTLGNAAEQESDLQSSANVLGPSFADRLRMSLQVNVQGNVRLQMPFTGVIGMLGTELNAELKPGGAIAIDRGDDLDSKVAGTINLTSNSTFRFYQPFTITEGQIKFTNDFSNPEIHIIADYSGTHAIDPYEAIKIELVVTGTKSNPDLKPHIYVTNPATNTTEERLSSAAFDDAIYFIAAGGYFKSDQTPAQQAPVLTKVYNSLGSQVVSNILSSTLGLGSSSSEFAIRQASLMFVGSKGADITAAYRNITFRANVAEANPANGVQGTGLQQSYIFDFPLSAFTTSQLVRSMSVEVQIHPTPSVGTGVMGQQPSFLTKVLWTPWTF